MEVPGRPASPQDDSDWQSDCRSVIVQWDYGERFKYRCGVEQKYDLRVLDNAPVGMETYLARNYDNLTDADMYIITSVTVKLILFHMFFKYVPDSDWCPHENSYTKTR